MRGEGSAAGAGTNNDDVECVGLHAKRGRLCVLIGAQSHSNASGRALNELVVCWDRFHGADGPRKGLNPPVARLHDRLLSARETRTPGQLREGVACLDPCLYVRASWLKKTAKDELTLLRVQNPEAVLADAQRHIARDYGFDSWRKLKRQVEQQRAADPSAVSREGSDASRDQSVREFLHRVGTGQIDEVRRALAAAPQMVNVVGPHPFWGGRPQLLHVAIESNRPDMFRLLLEAGADVNGSNDQYHPWSPLMLADHEERHDIRDELLRRGARVGLIEALLFGDDRLVEELLRPGAPGLPSYAPNGGSILNFARTIYAIDRLLDLGVASDVADRWGATPIESMSRLGSRGKPLVQHLIERGGAAAPEEYARMGDGEKLRTLLSVIRRHQVRCRDDGCCRLPAPRDRRLVGGGRRQRERPRQRQVTSHRVTFRSVEWRPENGDVTRWRRRRSRRA